MLYLHANGSLLPTAPPAAAAVAPGSAADDDEFTSYVYDPNDPVPSVGGNNLEIECGPLDQARDRGRER